MLDPRTPNFVFPSLRDRVAIITGAGRGLGSAFAKVATRRVRALLLR
jgi:NAD(P)-dependent dehydrogenase (short-subunit alcohol dehydrogenase family)